MSNPLKGGEKSMRIEIRSDSVILDGYVNATNRESRVLPSPKGPFVEQIMPRTFERALMTNPNVELLFNHDKNRKLGSTATGELQLREDNIGLRATATITDTEIIDKARKNELRGWSFGFQALRDNWQTREDGMAKRTVEEMYLAEVSVLDKVPAYIATSIEARGEEDVLTENRLEEFTATIEDNSEPKTDDKNEKRNDSSAETIDYSVFENDITFLQLRGL
jgi:Escherichia/Staphylococcus phage prohead protease